MSRGKDKQSAMGYSREDSTPAVSKPERGEAGSEGVGPADSRLQLAPHVQIAEDGGPVDPRIGESSGMQAS